MAVSRRYVDGADLVLVCVDGQTDGWAGGRVGVEPALSADGPSERQSNRLVLRTKSDLGGGGPGLTVSAVTGDGLDRLRTTIAQRIFGEQIALADLEPALTQARHQEALGRARSALEAARPHLADGDGEPVLAAHHVREATLALDELLGTIDIDEVLDRIFAAFCVGK
jgi:tRNA modification GTPase